MFSVEAVLSTGGKGGRVTKHAAFGSGGFRDRMWLSDRPEPTGRGGAGAQKGPPCRAELLARRSWEAPSAQLPCDSCRAQP